VLIVPVPASATYALRHSVLRPHQTLAEMAFAGDDLATSRHLGACPDDDTPPVGVASIYQNPAPPEFVPAHPLLASSKAFQLRGMATDPTVRGTGVGGGLLIACFAHATILGGNIFWCNARTSVRGFYEHHGLEAFGDEYHPPGIGPHVFMWRLL